MNLDIKPIDPARADFAGEVSGVEIAAGVSADQALQIDRAMDHFGVLVFRNQIVNDDQQFTFSEHFGPMEKATGDVSMQAGRRLSMDLNDISNLDRHGQVLKRTDRARLFGLGNMLWHSDSSFKEIPARYSLLSAHAVPTSGGNTEFADMRAAWDDLSEDLKEECKELVCIHSQVYSRGSLGFTDFTEEELAKWQPVRQKLVRRHPSTDRLSLFLSSHIGDIEGWPTPEARLFIKDLTEHATAPRFVYIHEWRQWDLVMWDNRTLMHRARRYDHTQPRDLRRTTVSDGVGTA